MLKIYIQYHGYNGMIVVVAKTEAEAKILMERADNYYECVPIHEHEIKEGFIGDCGCYPGFVP